jgi:hypothetical protein
MSKHKKLTLRELRAERTLKEVSEGSGVPISTYRALEMGWGKNYAPALKHRVSDYFGVNFFQLFPEERERLEGIIIERQEGRHRLLTLYDFVPGLRFKDEEKAAAILMAMNLDELGDLFHSGLTEEEALEHLRRAAKKYKLVEPKVK